MKLIIKKAKIIDAQSKHHEQTMDLLIDNGVIQKIAANIEDSKAEVFEADNLHISQGWMDLNARFGEPGYEYKEDFESGLKAAAQGGFTQVALMPSTLPAIQSKSDINFVKQQTAHHIVDIHPIGALTQDRKGEQISEMYDMHMAGAIAFSDDKRSIANASLMKVAMLYTKNFEGIIMSYSSEEKISINGQMNEGMTSTHMGLKGIPALAEELQLARDLHLCEYTGAKVHFSTISTAESVELIRRAKAKGLNISADVSAYHLLLDDTQLESFDSNLKVNPPLRSKSDIKALVNGLKDGTINAICTDHKPENIENKRCEFDNAAFGIIGLETAFASANTALNGKLDINQIIEKLSTEPKTVLGFESSKIEEGALADLTLFDPELKWKFEKEHIASKSKNTPFIGTEFIGKALAIVNNGQIQVCQ